MAGVGRVEAVVVHDERAAALDRQRAQQLKVSAGADEVAVQRQPRGPQPRGKLLELVVAYQVRQASAVAEIDRRPQTLRFSRVAFQGRIDGLRHIGRAQRQASIQRGQHSSISLLPGATKP